MLREAQVNERMEKESIPHGGFSLAFDNRMERIDMQKHTGNGG